MNDDNHCLLVEEEAELVEAVEALVETAAVSVWSTIMDEIEQVLLRVKDSLEWALPVLIEYQQDRSRLIEDLQHCAITLLLLLLGFFVLAPSDCWWRKREKSTIGNLQHARSRSGSSYQLHSLDNHSVDTASEQTYLQEDDSMLMRDEERFELEVWPNMDDMCQYRRLVLPPACKRTEKPTLTVVLQSKRRQKSADDEREATHPPHSGEDDHDNPAGRLQHYWHQFLSFFAKFVRLDWPGAILTVFTWFQSLHRYRKQQNNNNDDDNNSKATAIDEEDSCATTATTTTTTKKLLPETILELQESSSIMSASSQTGGAVRIPQPSQQGADDDISECASALQEVESNSPPQHEEQQPTSRPRQPSFALEDPENDGSSANVIRPPQHHHNADLATVEEEKKDNRSEESSMSDIAPSPVLRGIDPNNDLFHVHGNNSFNLGGVGGPESDDLGETSSQDANSVFESPLAAPKHLLFGSPTSATPAASNLTTRGTAVPKQRDALGAYRTNSASNITGLGGGGMHLHNLPTIDTARQQQSLGLAFRPSPEVSHKVLSPVESLAEGESSDGLSPEATATTSTSPERKLVKDPGAVGSSAKYFFETAHSRDTLKKLELQVPVPDRNGYIVGDHYLEDESQSTPLLVFVNSRSGPQQGQLLITQLRRLLNPVQVWDLATGGPEEILESFLAFTRLRILVCGGDGTVSWIISALESLTMPPSRKKWPPIAILPLGTGNDLARIHGWGGGYNNESLISILEQVSQAYISLLDRWEATIEDKKTKKKSVKTFFNYLGVGADAQAALQVHCLRESRPQWFFSRLVNKAWYGIFGAEDMIMASSLNVRKNIQLFADGVPVQIPSDSQGIIILNIDSYMGGIPLWSHGVKEEDKRKSKRSSIAGGMGSRSAGRTAGDVRFSCFRGAPRRSLSMNEFQFRNSASNSRKRSGLDRVDSSDDLHWLCMMSEEDRFARVTACDRPSSCQDGMLEIISIRGAFHLGQIRVGLSNAQRLCQCREAKIHLKNKVPVQLDGEPWRQRPCTITVTRKEGSAVMLHRSSDDGGVETEMSKLLDWAEERKLIDEQVHAILMKEFSRRIESNERRKRVTKDTNIMFSLKKAISQGALGVGTSQNQPPGSMTWNGGIAF